MSILSCLPGEIFGLSLHLITIYFHLFGTPKWKTEKQKMFLLPQFQTDTPSRILTPATIYVAIHEYRLSWETKN